MNIMKSILSTILTLLLATSAFAQTTISGKVQDEQSAPIAYATVSVLRSDSSLVTGAITDDDGAFALSTSTGNYILQVSFVGYQTHCQTVKSGTKDLLITLREESYALGEVEVKANKQLIEHQFDKIVLNVSNSTFAMGNNGKEILKKAPGVNVDKDGNVTVNGKSVEVYIDGRPSYLSGQQLKAMLEGTDGSTIEKIEIISNPSAKYDASGQGGIINIKTKRNMMRGLNGTLSGAYGGMYYKDIAKWQNMDFFSLNLNYRTEKTYTFGTLTQVYSDQNSSMEVGSTYLDSLANSTTERYDKSEYVCDFQYYMAKIGNDWFIDSVNTLGFIFQAPFMVLHQNVPLGNGYGYTKVNDITTENSTLTIESPMFSQQYTANLNFTHVFSDSLERELTANIDYNRNGWTSGNKQTNTYSYPLMPDSILNTKLDINTKQVVDIYSAKLDFQTRFWQTGMIEAGAKYALSNTNNRMTTDSARNDVSSATAHSDFDYSEHVAALYISVAKQFGQHFNAKLGLRGEYTHSQGNWISADSISTKDYFNLFPTAFLGYNPTDKWSMNLSYTRRIKRPSYYQLNPFRSYIDAHNYTEGNPELTPEFNNQVDLNVSYSQYVSLAFNFSHTQDMFSQRTEILPNGDSRMQWVNFGTCTTHGGNLSLTELPIVPKYVTSEDGSRQMQGAWLALTVNGGYYYFINRSADNLYVNRSHWGYVYTGLNAYLPKDWTLSVEGSYQAPNTSGYNRTSAFYFLGCGVRKMWQEKRLIFNLQVQDVLRSMKERSDAFGLAEGCSSYSKQNYRAQKVMLSVTWMFGQQQYVKQRKVGDLDESSRLGGGKNVGQ